MLQRSAIESGSGGQALTSTPLFAEELQAAVAGNLASLALRIDRKAPRVSARTPRTTDGVPPPAFLEAVHPDALPIQNVDELGTKEAKLLACRVHEAGPDRATLGVSLDEGAFFRNSHVAIRTVGMPARCASVVRNASWRERERGEALEESARTFKRSNFLQNAAARKRRKLTSHAHVPQFPLAIHALHVVLSGDFRVRHRSTGALLRVRLPAQEQLALLQRKGPVTSNELVLSAQKTHVHEARVQVVFA